MTTPTMTPAAWDLLQLARRPDFDRITAAVTALRGCDRPIQLAGSTRVEDLATREVLHSFDTINEPFGRILVPCGNRRQSRCPSCSRLYAADTFQLIRAGLSGGKSVPETVTSHPRVFLTLTAPSFGKVHNRRNTKTGNPIPCACGALHPATDAILGTPLNPATYDYAGAVLFNAHAGMLWARFTTYLRRTIPRHAGIKVKQFREQARLSFAKVAEYQNRGLVHFHAIVRIDGPEGPTGTLPSWATTQLLTDAIEDAHRQAALTLESDAVAGTFTLRWGDQLDVKPITTPGPHDDDQLTEQAVAGYIAKYATKNAENSGTVDRPLRCKPCQGRGNARARNGFLVRCLHCDGTGQAERIADLPVAEHARRMIQTCWDLDTLPEFAHLGFRKWAHMLGFRGHFSTKSRRYSTTLGKLRGARRDWQAEKGRERLGLPPLDEETTLVIKSWHYIGTGYTPAEELLAQDVRHNIAELLQQRREGGGAA